MFKSLSIQSYLTAIKSTLDMLLCLKNFPSELVEKHNKPEIEMNDHDKSCKHLCLKPILISRS
jgi:actin related protein 2/3 complex subunit 4